MDYVIWKPAHDGHAPPNWREGMWWDCEPFSKDHSLISGVNPSWLWSITYKVPAEALNSPNDDASVEYKERQLAYILEDLRQCSPELLAKHGITLDPEKDWATELWADLFAVRGMSCLSKTVRDGLESDQDRAAIELLRTRFEQMLAERSKA